MPEIDVTEGERPGMFSDPGALEQALRYTYNYSLYLSRDRYAIFYTFFVDTKPENKMAEEYYDLEQRTAFEAAAEAGSFYIRERYNESHSDEFQIANPTRMQQLYDGVIAPYTQLHTTAADPRGDFKRTKTGALIAAVVDKHV